MFPRFIWYCSARVLTVFFLPCRLQLSTVTSRLLLSRFIWYCSARVLTVLFLPCRLQLSTVTSRLLVVPFGAYTPMTLLLTIFARDILDFLAFFSSVPITGDCMRLHRLLFVLCIKLGVVGLSICISLMLVWLADSHFFISPSTFVMTTESAETFVIIFECIVSPTL